MTNSMTNFVHLHCHSEYSLLESPIRIKQLIAKALEHNMSAISLTDNANFYGAIDFYKQAKAAGIKPILGVDFYLCDDMAAKQRFSSRLLLYAKSNRGYQQLIKLITKAHLEGVYYKPRLDFKAIQSLETDDLIAISPGGRGPIAVAIGQHQEETAEFEATRLKELFGDRFYIGIQRTKQTHEDMINAGSIEIANSLGVPIVATHDVQYIQADDAVLREVLFCIQTGRQLDSDRLDLDAKELYFKTPQQMSDLFADIPEAIENTKKIADACNLTIEMDQVLLPQFDCPEGLTSEAYLEKLVWQGIEKLYPTRGYELEERVNFELNIINKMKYANYFLIIYDFLDFCQKKEIPVGPGRGSAAGSIVSYALQITKLDPIKYNLLFERFLNPERVSMPDIDIDFCIRRRSEVIAYIVAKYGQDCVSQIITFGTMQSRAVVRDVGRALGVALSDVDRIAKLIPATPGTYISIEEALEQVSELKNLYTSNQEFKELLDMSRKLEGQTRHTSTHAAGVVISSDPLTTFVPLTSNDGQISTQYAMADIEQIGLLKMDILGLRNLTVIDDTVRYIHKHSDANFNMSTIPLDDKATYQHLSQGRGVAVFQLESKGMRQLLKDMKPKVFEDIIALLALFRPGPLGSGMVSEFISNKSGKTEVKYELPELEPVLKETSGMILYQEQVMQIASVIGGFTLAQADVLRRAMGKKKKSEMDKMKETFLAGAQKNGFSIEKSRGIFETCEKFAEYGFNKSHSTAYALISYQTAYLKTHYLVEYMVALLSSTVSNAEKTSVYINECNELGVQVLAPNVNESNHDFSATRYIKDNESKSAIRFGLAAIKNVGEGAIESIIQNRPYNDLVDFCMKVDLKQVNKRVVESLIKSGAMDDFGERSYLLAIFELVTEKAQVLNQERSNGQISLFSDQQAGMSFSLESIQPEEYRIYSEQEKLKMEKELIGLFISGHPLELVRAYLEKSENTIKSAAEKNDYKLVSITGLLSNIRKVTTKQKKEMIIAQLDDLTGNLAVLLFEEEGFQNKADLFREDSVVKITGRCRKKEDEISMICQDIELIDQGSQIKSIYFDLDSLADLELKNLRTLCLSFKGTMPVYFKIADVTVRAHQKYWIKDDELVKKQFEQLLGLGRVWVV